MFVFLFFAFADENDGNRFGRCRCLTNKEIGSLYDRIMMYGSDTFKKQFVTVLYTGYESNTDAEPLYFKVIKNGEMGIFGKKDSEHDAYFIVFPPQTKWRFFTPDKGITLSEIVPDTEHETDIHDISGLVFVFTEEVNTHIFRSSVYTNAN